MGVSSAIGSLGFKPGVCTSTTRPAAPYEGQLIFETDTDSVAFWDGSYWRYIEARKNLLYNGAMQVAQRGTSTASITTSGYYTADRWRTAASSLGTWTQAIVSTTDDYPAGSGFRQSLKMTCTTSNASPVAGAFILVQQFLEGQDLQSIRKGTSSAQQITMSFWVRSGTTGTYIAELLDNDNTRQCSKAYTISAANTWEFKTIVFPADTTGVLDNDNQASLFVNWWLGAGSSFTSGTLNTSWAASTSANRVVGQVNLASATNNYWQITGVQLNVGSVAAPFEFKSYGQELRECQRYFQRHEFNIYGYAGFADSTTSFLGVGQFVPVMRTGPSLNPAPTASDFEIRRAGVTSSAVSAISTNATISGVRLTATTTGLTAAAGGIFTAGSGTKYLNWDSEL